MVPVRDRIEPAPNRLEGLANAAPRRPSTALPSEPSEALVAGKITGKITSSIEGSSPEPLANATTQGKPLRPPPTVSRFRRDYLIRSGANKRPGGEVNPICATSRDQFQPRGCVRRIDFECLNTGRYTYEYATRTNGGNWGCGSIHRIRCCLAGARHHSLAPGICSGIHGPRGGPPQLSSSPCYCSLADRPHQSRSRCTTHTGGGSNLTMYQPG
jgi:hypothetical protein